MSNRNELREVISGFLLTCGCHIITPIAGYLVLKVILAPLFEWMRSPLIDQTITLLTNGIFGFVLSQSLYIGPLIIWFARKTAPVWLKASLLRSY
jgi:hypothetical protein